MTLLGMKSVESSSILASRPVERQLQSFPGETFETFLNR
jgi:hypothetical protein